MRAEASTHFSYNLSRNPGLVRTREDNLMRGLIVKNFLIFIFHLPRVKPLFLKTNTNLKGPIVCLSLESVGKTIL